MNTSSTSAAQAGLKRTHFPAQADVVQAIDALLLDRGEQAGIINAEMGTGKTMMAIAVAAVLHAEGYRRTLAEHQRRELVASQLLRVDGTVETRDGVLHVVAGRLEDVSELLQGFNTRSRDFH